MSATTLLTLRIINEQDVVFARQRARHIAELLGFATQDQTRIATAVSEIARNAYEYAHGGTVSFALEENKPPKLIITVCDKGAGIADLADILEGRYRSRTGMGLGIVGARRLMDDFRIESDASGTGIWLTKILPLYATPNISELTRQLSQIAPQDLFDEVQRQNRELLAALEELRARQDELQRLNSELEDTNRGVVALYAELDERADELRRANEVKTRFLSSMSHELRTPINGILGLTRLLQKEVDGPLNAEQQKQVGFIRASGESLGEIVNDLLDLAKVEAGKVSIRPQTFEVEEIFGALRGIMKPLLADAPVQLVFKPVTLPPLHTDDGKLSQILRNFISNAIKFTPQGEVRVSARLLPADEVEFCVADTGIGIAPSDIRRVWDEFSQIETPLQKRTKGTGLGLPLSRKLAELLGGAVRVESEVGAGSQFFVVIPRNFRGSNEGTLVSRQENETPSQVATAKTPVILIIDDSDVDRYLLREKLELSAQVMEAADGTEGLRLAQEMVPDAIFLDLEMPNLNGAQVLQQLRAAPQTSAIPIVIHSSHTLDEDMPTELATQVFAVLNKKRTTESAAQLKTVLEKLGLRSSISE